MHKYTSEDLKIRGEYLIMSKVTAIENAIIQLGAGEFQKFCDTFLSKKKQYGAIQILILQKKMGNMSLSLIQHSRLIYFQK